MSDFHTRLGETRFAYEVKSNHPSGNRWRAGQRVQIKRKKKLSIR